MSKIQFVRLYNPRGNLDPLQVPLNVWEGATAEKVKYLSMQEAGQLAARLEKRPRKSPETRALVNWLESVRWGGVSVDYPPAPYTVPPPPTKRVRFRAVYWESGGPRPTAPDELVVSDGFARVFGREMMMGSLPSLRTRGEFSRAVAVLGERPGELGREEYRAECRKMREFVETFWNWEIESGVVN